MTGDTAEGDSKLHLGPNEGKTETVKPNSHLRKLHPLLLRPLLLHPLLPRPPLPRPLLQNSGRKEREKEPVAPFAIFLLANENHKKIKAKTWQDTASWKCPDTLAKGHKTESLTCWAMRCPKSGVGSHVGPFFPAFHVYSTWLSGHQFRSSVSLLITLLDPPKTHLNTDSVPK